MNLTKKITLALGLLAAAGASFAQTAANTATTGLLGQRYGEVSFGVQDIKHLSTNVYSLGAAVNAPVVPAVLDVGAAYDYSWIRGGGVRGHSNTFGGYATAYTALAGVKPFLSGAVGWQWSSARGFGDDDQGLWALAAGVEIPAGPVTLTPRISYADDFESSVNSSQEWTYAVEANYWVNTSTAVFGSVGYTDVLRSSLESWNYRVGLRVKF
jgi:hypothetical protein